MVINVVVPRIDGAVKDQVADRPTQWRAAPRRHDLIVLRNDQGRGRQRTVNELDRGHLVAEEQADRSPPVMILRLGL